MGPKHWAFFCSNLAFYMLLNSLGICHGQQKQVDEKQYDFSGLAGKDSTFVDKDAVLPDI